MSERMSDSRSFEVLTASPVRLSSSPARSYRSWSDEEKARIVGETLVAGANVSAIARSNGLDPSQLFAWRRQAKASGVVVPLAAAASKPVRLDVRAGAHHHIADNNLYYVAPHRIKAHKFDRLADVIRAVRKA